MNAPALAQQPEVTFTQPVRFSHLRAYGRSPAHGRHARLVEMDPTYAMERGTVVHALIFGNRKVAGYPGAKRAGNEYEAFAAAHPDTEILTMAEFDKARRMADAVRASELAMSVLAGVKEKTILFRWMGLDCRSTPDVRGANYLTELKSSSSADPVRFPWHAIRMQYHAQMRLQTIAASQSGPARERKIDDCFIVCVEEKPPFPVTVFRMDERALEVGEKLLMLWAERLKGAEASRTWPPYVTCIVPIDVPDEEPELIFADEDA